MPDELRPRALWILNKLSWGPSGGAHVARETGALQVPGGIE